MSATASRSGVSNGGAMEMSTAPLARIETLLSEVTGVASMLTPRRRAYSSASLQAGPWNGAASADGFLISHGNSLSTATRSVPRCRIASIRVLAPGGGAETFAPQPATGVANSTTAASSVFFHDVMRALVSFKAISVRQLQALRA